jgi:ABC-2 type transport system permease protein
MRSKTRIFASLGQPVLFLLAFGYGFGPIFSRAGAGNYIDFLAPGIIGMAIIFSAMFSGIEVIWDRQFGFLKETMVAPSSRFSIAVGRTLGGATISVFQGVIVLIISMLVGFHPASLAALPLVLVAMFLLAIFFTAFGTAIAVRMTDMQSFPLIMNFIMMPLFFLSGALFPIEGLSSVLSFVVKANPLSYGLDALRGLLIGHYQFSLGLDTLVMLIGSALFLYIAGKLFERVTV